MPGGGGGVVGQISEQRLREGGPGGLGHGVVGRPGRGLPAPRLAGRIPVPKLIYGGSVGVGSIRLDFHRRVGLQSLPVEGTKIHNLKSVLSMARKPEKTRQDWEMVSGPLLPAPRGRGGAWPAGSVL